MNNPCSQAVERDGEEAVHFPDSFSGWDEKGGGGEVDSARKESCRERGNKRDMGKEIQIILMVLESGGGTTVRSTFLEEEQIGRLLSSFSNYSRGGRRMVHRIKSPFGVRGGWRRRREDVVL